MSEILSTPWLYTAAEYQHEKGVHQPWIAEISPYQHTSMSKRQQAAYDKKRSGQWQASADVKWEWRQLVIAALERGDIDHRTAGLTDEAKSVILYHVEEKRKAATKERAKANRIGSLDNVLIGDRVYDLVTRRYGRVIKKLKAAVTVEWEEPMVLNGKAYTTGKIQTGALWWLSFDEAQQRAADDLPIVPERATP